MIAPLVCLDPGHGTPPAIGRQVEPVGPGSRTMKIKDGGGAAGEASVALAIALKARRLLLARGYRVAMTRTGPVIRLGDGDGNIARAKFCNRRQAAWRDLLAGSFISLCQHDLGGHRRRESVDYARRR